MEKLKVNEQSNRNKLQEKKPKVYDKIMKQGMKQIPRIQLQWRTNCNFNCSHCSVSLVNHDKDKLLTFGDAKKLFDDADKLGISRMTISGGEPLLFDLEELVKTIGADRFWIQLDTNAWLLTETRIKQLKELGIDCIAPSLDSLNFKEHDTFRNSSGSAKKVIEAFNLIQKYEFNTFVQTVVTKTRLYSYEFIQFLEYFNNRGIGVFVSFAKPVGNFSGHFEELIDKKDLEFFEKLEKKYKCFSHLTPAYGINEERNCVAGKNIFGISCTGEIIPCIYCYISMGNVKEESFEVIYDRMQKLNIFRRNTCPMADKSDNFISKYLVHTYGKNLPISYKEILTKEDFDK